MDDSQYNVLFDNDLYEVILLSLVIRLINLYTNFLWRPVYNSTIKICVHSDLYVTLLKVFLCSKCSCFVSSCFTECIFLS